MKCKMCQVVEMRVLQISKETNKMTFECPRCHETEEKDIEELEKEIKGEDEEVVDSALDEATNS